MVAVVTLIASTVGCGALVTHEASRDVYDNKGDGKPGKNDVSKPKNRDDWFLVEMSKKYGLMALFALTAYRYDMVPSDRDHHGCDYLNPDFLGDRNFGMPKAVESNSASERWERWVPDETKGGDAQPCLNENGLFYETYVYRDSHNQIAEAVIAYRGTENRKGQWATDWSTNLANFFGFEPAEYALARDHLKKLTNRLRRDAPKARIYAVGHSLGGGLAQQAGYLSKDIAEVYTFNTTPVTNWSHLRILGLVEQGYPIIHRVYNGGEGLAGIRAVATASTSTRYGRHDVQVQFGPKSPVAGHGMSVIACSFANLLSETNAQDAMHNYPPSYINQYVLARQGEVRVCNDEVSGVSPSSAPN